MTRWPAWRTAHGGDRHVTYWDMTISALVAFALPLALGLTLGRLPGLEILTIFAISSFFAPFMLLIGLLLGLSALRHGWAGWAVSLLVGGAAAYLLLLFFVVLDDGLVALAIPGAHVASATFCPVGMTYASLMWITLYIRRPKALLSDNT